MDALDNLPLDLVFWFLSRMQANKESKTQGFNMLHSLNDEIGCAMHEKEQRRFTCMYL